MTSDQIHEQDLSEDEIDRLIAEHDFDELQTLQLEIHNELFQSGMGWDDRSNWYVPYNLEDTDASKEILILKQEVQLFAASCFVQYKRKYIDVVSRVELTDLEIFRALSQKIAEKFHTWYKRKLLTANMIDEVSFAVVNGTTIDPRMSFALHSGKEVICPGNPARRLWRNGYCDLNVWEQPAYRTVNPAQRDAEKPLGSLQDLLNFAIKTPLERQILLDWFGWSLKNEHLKPKWAIFLFSETKGTGKSSLLELGQALFGEENTAAENGIQGLTDKFAIDSLNKKFIKVEEVKLSSHSDAGNKMKDYITGDSALLDVKNNKKQHVALKAAFMMTTNHKPTWLEGGERRYFIVDMDHEGHAYGARKDEFDKITRDFRQDLSSQEILKRWYLELIDRDYHPDFDPFVLKPNKIGSPLMQELMGEAKIEVKEVLADLLDQYDVKIFPSRDQQLIVDRLKLRNQQALRNLLKDLGWEPSQQRIDGKQMRIWARRSNAIENSRIDAPTLSKGLEGAVELGYTWWSLTKEIAECWDVLVSEVLRPGRFIQKTSDKGKTTTMHEMFTKPQEDYSRGPFADSKSDLDYASYVFVQNQNKAQGKVDTELKDLDF